MIHNPFALTAIFVAGTSILTYLLFVLLGQRTIRQRGELVDINFVSLAVLLVGFTACTLCAMLLLGKAH